MGRTELRAWQWRENEEGGDHKNKPRQEGKRVLQVGDIPVVLYRHLERK